MDRAYFDPFAFSTGQAEVNRKAKALDREFRNHGKPFEDGHIFFLSASKDALSERMVRRGSFRKKDGSAGYDADRLKEQEEELKKIYCPEDGSIFDTSDSTVADTAKRIARAILLGPYSQFEFRKRLDHILKSKGAL